MEGKATALIFYFFLHFNKAEQDVWWCRNVKGNKFPVSAHSLMQPACACFVSLHKSRILCTSLPNYYCSLNCNHGKVHA